MTAVNRQNAGATEPRSLARCARPLVNGHGAGRVGGPCCARRSGRRSFRCAARRSNRCANAFRHRAHGAASEQPTETNDAKRRRGAMAAATRLRRYRRPRMRVRKRRCGAERNDGTGWCRSTDAAGEDYASRNCHRKREQRCANFAHRLDPTSPEGHGLSRLHSTGLLKVLNTRSFRRARRLK